MSLFSRIGCLVGLSGLVGLVAWGIAESLFGPGHVLPAVVGFVGCSIPAVIGLVLFDRVVEISPEAGAVAVIVGVGLRMFGVVALVLLADRPLMESSVNRDRLIGWIVVFYLITLAVESGLLMLGRTSREGPRDK